ncbi:lactonase family protein [Actinoplanes awajinensis]|nr:beta-propeller fold lactonase family protein [Actinoplanes awajinensis]
MRKRTGVTIAAALLMTGGAVVTGIASAQETPKPAAKGSASSGAAKDRGGMVLVQSNDPKANSILAFRRATNGKLTATGVFKTGGRGGSQKDNPFDPLASQESLVFDKAHRTVLVVNAGSNTVTTFRVRGERLVDPQTVASGGYFPTSIAVRGTSVFVLNAGGKTNVTGFELTSAGLKKVSGSTRELGVTNAVVPLFTDSPPQVGFTPNGKQLLVSTKSKNTIEVFEVDGVGRLSAEAVSTTSVGAVPFSFVFDKNEHLLMTEAGNSGVSSYTVEKNGTLKAITRSVESGQKVLCWIARAGDFFYGTNPGSSTISQYIVDDKGHVGLGGKQGVIADAGGAAAVKEVAEAEAGAAKAPGAGPIDLAATADGKLLYVQNTLAGTVEGFQVGADGSLKLVTTLKTGLPVFKNGSGMEGIVVW